MGENWVNWTLMIMPPGAFFMLGIVIWISRNVFNSKEEEGEKV
jgi:Na+-transporting NADH:ubiquinone oxidoreductase subunit D